jgi:hypothetical protein
MGPNPVGQTGSYNQPLIVPAGYAFSIWGIIYLGLIIFPIYQWRFRRKGDDRWIPIRQWYALNVILNGLWLVFASYDWLWMSVATIIVMLVSLYKINNLLIQIKSNSEDINYTVERFVFSVYFAWIMLATVLNISAALSFYQWSGWVFSEYQWSLIMLPIIALLAGLVFLKYRDSAFSAVVVWAFVALIVKHISTNPTLAYISIAVVAIFLALIFRMGRKWPTISVNTA